MISANLARKIAAETATLGNKYVAAAIAEIEEYNAQVKEGEPGYPSAAVEIIALLQTMQSLQQLDMFKNQARM